MKNLSFSFENPQRNCGHLLHETVDRSHLAGSRKGMVVSELTIVFFVLAILATLVLIGAEDNSATSTASYDRTRPVRAVGVAGADEQILVTLYDDQCIAHNLQTSASKGLWIRRVADDRIEAVATSPVGTAVAFAFSDGTLNLIDAEASTTEWSCRPERSTAQSIVFSPDGSTLAVGTETGQILLVSTASGQHIRSVDVSLAVEALCFTPGGRQFVVTGRDEKLLLFDSSTGNQLRTFEGRIQRLMCLAISPDGRFVAAGTADGSLSLWDFTSGCPISHCSSGYSPVVSIGFSPDGRQILTGSCDGRVRVRALKNLADVRTFRAHVDTVRDLAFAGPLLITGGHDGAVRAWDHESLKPRTIPVF